MRKDAARLHQAHPLKLATDGLSALAALALLWRGHALAGVLLLLVPPLAATLLVLRFVDLDPLAGTRWGRAVVARMDGLTQGLRLAGLLVAAVGAWWHYPAEIVLGLLVVAAGWATTLREALRQPPA